MQVQHALDGRVGGMRKDSLRLVRDLRNENGAKKPAFKLEVDRIGLGLDRMWRD